MRNALLAGLAITVSACTTQAEFDTKPVNAVVSFSENYQAVYARTNRGFRNCMTASSGGFIVDGQLYPDLQYGEVTATGGSGAYPMLYAKVSKQGDGARVEIKSAIRGDGATQWAKYWAAGGLECQKLTYHEAPPAI